MFSVIFSDIWTFLDFLLSIQTHCHAAAAAVEMVNGKVMLGCVPRVFNLICNFFNTSGAAGSFFFDGDAGLTGPYSSMSFPSATTPAFCLLYLESALLVDSVV
jgi:hypothetical protein